MSTNLTNQTNQKIIIELIRAFEKLDRSIHEVYRQEFNTFKNISKVNIVGVD